MNKSSSLSGNATASSSTMKSNYKTVLLGDASVGKSSLVIRFVKNTFSDTMETTIGAAFFTQTLELDKNQSIKFEIWDTAGQERFSSLAPMYYRGAAAAIVVFDQNNSASFDRAQMWVQQLQLSGNPNIVIALAANKMDLKDSQYNTSSLSYSNSSNKVNLLVAQQYAEENNLLFIETSAKTGQNVQELFTMIARRLPQMNNNTNQSTSLYKTVKLTNEDLSKTNTSSGLLGSKCC